VPYRKAGLERVAYSPKEWNIPGFCGADALIRFWVDPEEYTGWTGSEPVVINITQHLQARHPYTNYEYWDEATRGLVRIALGPGSEAHGGTGPLSYTDMQGWLRRARAYLYTGTQPASYTLGLIEAMMTGTPIVSIGPSHMSVFPYGPDLFEGHELANHYAEDPAIARQLVEHLLENRGYAHEASRTIRARAIDLFGKETIAAQWAAYLGTP
jgi:glycosyltransferase involved in cell wall biosynthesis